MARFFSATCNCEWSASALWKKKMVASVNPHSRMLLTRVMNPMARNMPNTTSKIPTGNAMLVGRVVACSRKVCVSERFTSLVIPATMKIRARSIRPRTEARNAMS